MSLWHKLKSNYVLRLFDCRAAARAQSEAMDHPLTMRRYVWLQLHLLICRWCRRYGRQIRFLRQASHEHADDSTAVGRHSLSLEARDRLKRNLK